MTANAEGQVAQETTLEAILADLPQDSGRLAVKAPDGQVVGLDLVALTAVHEVRDRLPPALDADGGLKVHVENPLAFDTTGLARDATVAAVRDRLPAAFAGDGGLQVHVLNETPATDVSALSTAAKQDAQTTLLTTLAGVSFATSADMATVESKLDAIATNTANIKLDADHLSIAADSINLETAGVETRLDTLDAKDFATQTTLAQLYATAQLGATDATVAAMSAKLPAVLVAGRLSVDGSGVTQPVSAAALPLPAGAAQEHVTAASPHSVRLSDGAAYLGTTAGRLQVADGGVALKVDGSAVTQPVSIAALPALPAGGNLIGHVDIDNFPAVQAVSQSGAPWSVQGSVAPSDAFAGPTTAQATFALGGVYNGATWDRLASATGANTGVLAAAGDSRVLSGTGAALNATPVSADLRGYRWVSITCSTDGTWNAQFAFETSNDGATWTPQSLSQSSATGPQTASGAFGPNQNVTYHGALAGRYFRVRVTPYTAGTLTVNGIASALPGAFEALNATISPASSVNANADTNAGANLFPIGNWVYGGAAWDRWRSAASAQGTTGTGVAAAAAMGFDGTNYRAASVDTSGRQTVVGIGAAGSDGTGSVTNWIPMPVHIYTGSGTWDRMRTASGAAATTGAGLLGVGTLGFDGTNYQRVTMASAPGDATAGGGILAAGGWIYNGATFDRQRGNSGSAYVTQSANATAPGLSTYRAAQLATVSAVKASSGRVYGFSIYNPNASVVYIQLFDAATASVVLGTTAPKRTIPVAATSAVHMNFDTPWAFATAISLAATTTAIGSTAPGTAVETNIDYA